VMCILLTELRTIIPSIFRVNLKRSGVLCRINGFLKRWRCVYHIICSSWRTNKPNPRQLIFGRVRFQRVWNSSKRLLRAIQSNGFFLDFCFFTNSSRLSCTTGASC